MHGEHGGWRHRRRWFGVVAVVGVLGVAACSGSSSSPTPSSSSTTATVTAPTPSPSLTAEQRAAEEAKAAYSVYRKTLDAVFQRGGTNAYEDLSKVATGAQLTFLLDEASEFMSNKVHQVGSATVKSLKLHDVHFEKGKLPQVLVRVCADATTEDAIDPSGQSVRQAGALAHFIEIVTLTRYGGKGWLVSQEDDTPVKSC